MNHNNYENFNNNENNNNENNNNENNNNENNDNEDNVIKNHDNSFYNFLNKNDRDKSNFFQFLFHDIIKVRNYDIQTSSKETMNILITRKSNKIQNILSNSKNVNKKKIKDLLKLYHDKINIIDKEIKNCDSIIQNIKFEKKLNQSNKAKSLKIDKNIFQIHDESNKYGELIARFLFMKLYQEEYISISNFYEYHYEEIFDKPWILYFFSYFTIIKNITNHQFDTSEIFNYQKLLHNLKKVTAYVKRKKIDQKKDKKKDKKKDHKFKKGGERLNLSIFKKLVDKQETNKGSRINTSNISFKSQNELLSILKNTTVTIDVNDSKNLYKLYQTFFNKQIEPYLKDQINKIEEIKNKKIPNYFCTTDTQAEFTIYQILKNPEKSLKDIYQDHSNFQTQLFSAVDYDHFNCTQILRKSYCEKNREKLEKFTEKLSISFTKFYKNLLKMKKEIYNTIRDDVNNNIKVNVTEEFNRSNQNKVTNQNKRMNQSSNKTGIDILNDLIQKQNKTPGNIDLIKKIKLLLQKKKNLNIGNKNYDTKKRIIEELINQYLLSLN